MTNKHVPTDEYLQELKNLQSNRDLEIAHGHADDILCRLLIDLGFQDIVDAYHKIDKWYA